VEMKSRGKNLDMAFSQAKNYVERLPERERPIFVMVCDFAKIRLYDLTKGIGADEYHEFEVSSLSRNIHHFAKILDFDDVVPDRGDFDEKVNVKAATMMAHLHENMESMVFSSHELQVYLVRILFCLFAEDAGIFEKFSFENYVKASREDGGDLAGRLSALFEVLDMPVDKRPAGMPDELRGFPYVNGKLFSETLHTAYLNDKVRTEILKCCNFDWDYISPAVFGAMFQGVMNPEERREAGAHYTSEENILKVIKPLFLDNLWAEFERVKHSQTALERFHEMLASLKFLDPACGCGNFLIIAYRELRKLEFEVIKILHPVEKGQFLLDCGDYAKVNVNQFYGIEYEEFPSQIAQVGMWLLDHQWNRILSEYYGFPFTRLPLTKSATIIHGNALRTDWEELVPKSELSYIMGNPPFLGYSMQNCEQKEDMLSTYVDENGKPFKTAGKIDYVSAWYYKAAKYMQGTRIRTAFVSTNSITQGEQVASVWKPLYELFGVTINFGYRTFKWSNEAKGKAAVHCVIIGFDTVGDINSLRFIFDEEGEKHVAKNISPYLIDMPSIFVESRKTPLCDVPEMTTGNRPADGGHLIIEEEDYDDFISREPQSIKYIKKLVGSAEFINNNKRWCLWLVGANPKEIKAMPEVLKRIDGCRKDRENAPDAGRRKLAETPMLFRETKNPKSYVVIPATSSESRKYLPLGFLDDTTIPTNAVLIIPDASLYLFGVLTSTVHMAWMRAVCGRLEMRYRYSKDIVYNNFPFPTPTEEQKSAIEKTAQAILDARALYPDSSLADLYDYRTMPPELRKAHEANDKAVEKAYGRKFADEGEIVAYLMQEYQRLVSEKK
ncbi:MAG: class I SAM-dependent DNA methyltransferase, partial [Methanocorpusculum sp.]|nr:class I SAM-dependent DNA methyltransferase [Methanocorpusculum sp.]